VCFGSYVGQRIIRVHQSSTYYVEGGNLWLNSQSPAHPCYLEAGNNTTIIGIVGDGS
jgi:hypothetical protein